MLGLNGCDGGTKNRPGQTTFTDNTQDIPPRGISVKGLAGTASRRGPVVALFALGVMHAGSMILMAAFIALERMLPGGAWPPLGGCGADNDLGGGGVDAGAAGDQALWNVRGGPR